jgi:hypothetical protein
VAMLDQLMRRFNAASIIASNIARNAAASA